VFNLLVMHVETSDPNQTPCQDGGGNEGNVPCQNEENMPYYEVEVDSIEAEGDDEDEEFRL